MRSETKGGSVSLFWSLEKEKRAMKEIRDLKLARGTSTERMRDEKRELAYLATRLKRQKVGRSGREDAHLIALP